MDRPSGLTSSRIIHFLGSRVFFLCTVIVFVLEASWIALTARYPQAFDEQFHLGIIKIYAQHLSPFLSQQPPNASQYGAVYRDPSYLYHYLMSFPYRLLTHLTGSQTMQIIILRLLNVALLASSLLIFRQVLRLIPLSRAMANVVLAFVVLMPVFPLLGSQISYDNLFIPLSGLMVYWTLVFLQTLRNQQVWRWDHVMRLLALGLLASLVKYPFLAIFMGSGLCIFHGWNVARKKGIHYVCVTGKHGRVRVALCGLALLVGVGLFAQRYAVNLFTYNTPIPECNQVLSVKQCLSYGPWGRNYIIAQEHLTVPFYQVLTYPFVWVYHMMGELVFTVSGKFNQAGVVEYFTVKQLIVVEVVTWTIFGLGLLTTLLQRRYIWRQPSLRVFIMISGMYLFALFIQNIIDFIHLGQPLSVHGRYLFPVLPLLFAIIALAVGRTIDQAKLKFLSSKIKAGLATALLAVLVFEGGGFVTYVLRSDSSWFWPQSIPAQHVNSKAQKLLEVIVLDTEPHK